MASPLLFSLNAPATTHTYTLSLHDALPISPRVRSTGSNASAGFAKRIGARAVPGHGPPASRLMSVGIDRKSTRLNSSHRTISYAVFCLKKKKIKNDYTMNQTKNLTRSTYTE